jgi:hypothetical protein
MIIQQRKEKGKDKIVKDMVTKSFIKMKRPVEIWPLLY